jgi:hypothetical protein
MITLNTDAIIAKTSKNGSETVEIPAGQWIEYRYGTPEAPIVILQQQVPAGKKWKLTANVYIEETDA